MTLQLLHPTDLHSSKLLTWWICCWPTVSYMILHNNAFNLTIGCFINVKWAWNHLDTVYRLAYFLFLLHSHKNAAQFCHIIVIWQRQCEYAWNLAINCSRKFSSNLSRQTQESARMSYDMTLKQCEIERQIQCYELLKMSFNL